MKPTTSRNGHRAECHALVRRTTDRSQPRRAAILGLAFAAVLGLTGCGGSSEAATSKPGAGGTTAAPPRDCVKGSSLTMIVPVHQGAQAPALPQQWQCAIEVALLGRVPINIVTAEGKPQVVLRGFTAEIETINPEAAHDDLVAAQNTVINAAAQARASSNGNDLLAALSLAADLSPGNGRGAQILSLDSGLTDTGVVRITEGLSGAAPKDVASFVTTNNACPMLKGKNVHFYGLAYGAPPQESLSQYQKDTISRIWSDIATTCGAAAQAVALPRTGPGPATRIFTTKPVTPDTPPTMKVAPGTIVRVPDNTALGFVIDSDKLRDPAAARVLLADVATQLKASPATHLRVTGSTSNGPTAWPSLTALSRARAATVGQLLIAMGVSTSQVTTTGAGYRAQPPVTGPASAAQNRAVTLSFS